MVTRFKFYLTLKDYLFKGVKLAKNVDPYKFVYTGYGIGFNLRLEISLPGGSVSKNVITLELI